MMRLVLTNFFASGSRSLPIEEFPRLFQMEAHAGLSGVFFASIWFTIVAFYVPPTRSSYWLLAITIIAAFFVLTWLSIFLEDHFASRLSHTQIDSSVVEEVEIRARMWIALLSAIYVLVLCLLIWLTGGVESPFVPFYVMIFTLTITKIRITPRATVVLLYFLCAFVLAILAREFWPPEFADMRQTSIKFVVDVGFICASLITPLVSTHLIDLRATKRVLDQMTSSYESEH